MQTPAAPPVSGFEPLGYAIHIHLPKPGSEIISLDADDEKRLLGFYRETRLPIAHVYDFHYIGQRRSSYDQFYSYNLLQPNKDPVSSDYGFLHSFMILPRQGMVVALNKNFDGPTVSVTGEINGSGGHETKSTIVYGGRFVHVSDVARKSIETYRSDPVQRLTYLEEEVYAMEDDYARELLMDYDTNAGIITPFNGVVIPLCTEEEKTNTLLMLYDESSKTFSFQNYNLWFNSAPRI